MAGRTVVDDRPRKRVLVVDDNQDTAEMLRTALEHFGYAVEVAFDGPSALARAARFDPSAVLLDIGLPAMDGYEVARRLRADRSGRSVRLLALTGYGQEADRYRSHDAGFDHHLVKPIDLDRLQALLEADNPTGDSCLTSTRASGSTWRPLACACVAAGGLPAISWIRRHEFFRYGVSQE